MNPHLTQESLPELLTAIAEAMQAGDQKLSPNRAKEFAAARIGYAIGAQFKQIDDKARIGEPIRAEEEDWYDLIAGRQWDYYQQLVNLSGSRTMRDDQDDPIAKLKI
jgi:Flp pilus assembly protein TadB